MSGRSLSYFISILIGKTRFKKKMNHSGFQEIGREVLGLF